MNGKDYLRRYLQMKHKIRDLLEERQRWEDLALRITPSYSSVAVSSSAGAGRIVTSVEQIEEWERKLDEQLSEQLRIRKEIENVVAAVENPDHQALLRMRYILGYTWEHIADEMHYGYQWIHKLHRQAIECVEEAIESDTDSVL